MEKSEEGKVGKIGWGHVASRILPATLKSEKKPLKTYRQAVMVGLYLHFEILHLTTQLVEGSGHGETYLEATSGL